MIFTDCHCYSEIVILSEAKDLLFAVKCRTLPFGPVVDR